MIYSTLKANKEAGIDIVDWYDETIAEISYAFRDVYGKYDWTEVSWEQVHKDFSEKEIKQRIWKEIKQEAKTGMLIKINKMFIECDMLHDVLTLTKKGIFKRSDLVELQRIASKREEARFSYATDLKTNEEYRSIEEVMDAFFPCFYDYETDTCTNCGNCE